MVTFLPSRPGRLADVPSFDRAIGGAESNVACVLAAAGHRVRWVSRVGADGFGDHLVAAIAAHGVDTGHVARDPHRPTGVYFRTAGERATGADGEAPGTAEVVYYRAGSAASAMTPGSPGPAALAGARVLHLTGITAALSDSCLDVLRTLTRRTPGRPLVSFDVNYRVGLWQGRPQGPETLLDLARGADVVFVGEDEAAAAWDLHGPEAIRAALPEPGVLVVKQGAEGVTVLHREDGDGRDGGEAGDAAGAGATAPAAHPGAAAPAALADTPAAHPGGATPASDRPVSYTPASATPAPDTLTYAPALTVDVIASVGAGDAFAAGFLSGTLRGLPVFDRIRHGHLTAAAALTVPGDLAVPPPRALADRLVALPADDWGRLRLGPGWTTGMHDARVEAPQT
ncbi:sugar kinase [Streptomyces sp. NPDC059080]|uniref:sugar kinase n=1 Tax=Streptomyces sp. NPDC059080 TaxID=3346718 RepID=UPI0036C082E3